MFTFERLRASLQTQRSKKFFATVIVAVIAIIGVFGTTHGVSAQTQTAPTGVCSDAGIISFVCSGVSFVLGMIAEFLGRLILLVLSVLIAFAQYNGFSKALPVEQGWVIVRDVTNMFFIIVLLLTAFATVIGRDEYHYSKILPGLLLQAVLINFSKTIIQLMIDFSQVVMLTFVNAFAQSAAGNFIYALGLDKMMNLRPNSGVEISSLMIAYMLAIFFMSITLGVVIILTAYLIYRIVAIWIALILAPLAFFVTALPGKFKSSLKGVGDEYWGKLMGMLTGGPVMAFFLWLTLAITQHSSSAATTNARERGSLAANLNLVLPSTGEDTAGTVTASSFGFISQIADTEHIASFVVGIALMLAALDAAVASAAIVGAGAIAALTKSKALSWGKSLATAPISLGEGIAKSGYGVVDRRFDLTRKASLVGTRALALTPAALRGDTYKKLRGGLVKGVNYRRDEAERDQQEEAAFNRNLSSRAKSLEERQSLLGIASSARANKDGIVTKTLSKVGVNIPSTLSTKAVENYYQEQYGDKNFIEDEFKATKHKYREQLKADGIKRGLSAEQADTEARAGSEVMVRNELNKRQGEALNARLAIARGKLNKKTGKFENQNSTEVRQLEELLKLNPHIAKEGKDKEEAIKRMIDSPDLYKDIPLDTGMSGEFLTELMLQNGWEDVKDSNGKAIGFREVDKAAWDLKLREMSRANPAVREAMDAHERFAKASPEKSSAQLKKIHHVKNFSDRTVQAFAIDNVDNTSPKMVIGSRVRGTEQQAALDASKRDSGSSTPPNVKGIVDAVMAGAPLVEALNNAGFTDTDQSPLEKLSTDYVAPTALQATSVLKSSIGAQDARNRRLIQAANKRYEKALDAAIVNLEGSALDAEEQRLAAARDAAIKLVESSTDTAKKQLVYDAARQAQDVIKVVAQAATKGVKRSQQELVVGEFMKNNGTDIITDIERFDNDSKIRAMSIIEMTRDIANDVLKVEASKRTASQNAIVDGYEALIRDLSKKGLQGELRKNLTQIPNTKSRA